MARKKTKEKKDPHVITPYRGVVIGIDPGKSAGAAALKYNQRLGTWSCLAALHIKEEWPDARLWWSRLSTLLSGHPFVLAVEDLVTIPGGGQFAQVSLERCRATVEAAAWLYPSLANYRIKVPLWRRETRVQEFASRLPRRDDRLDWSQAQEQFVSDWVDCRGVQVPRSDDVYASIGIAAAASKLLAEGAYLDGTRITGSIRSEERRAAQKRKGT